MYYAKEMRSRLLHNHRGITGRMKRTAAVLLCLAAMVAASAQEAKVGAAAPWTENAGQWDGAVRFAAQTGDAALFLEDDGVTVVMAPPAVHPIEKAGAGARRAHAYKVTFEGGKAIPEGEGETEGYSNYFVGDESRWRSRVKSYAAARYVDIYPGIDMEVYAARGGVKYNMIVHPGADPRNIVFRYSGVERLMVTKEGSLEVRTSVGSATEGRPYAYQGVRQVECSWQTRREGSEWTARFEVGDYDRRRELVIDPTLIFSTYTGSTADNWGTTAAYDSHKNTYTAGLVFDVGYPTTTGAYDVDYGGGVDIGIFKFDTSGGARLWATYLGGSSADMPHSMFVNMFDELLIFGTTGSADFPTTSGAYSRVHSGGTAIDYESQIIHFAQGSDIFVSRLSEDGTTLQASTLVGGTGNDGLNYYQRFNRNELTIMQGNDSLYYNYGDGARGELITDELGNVYVGSTTMSTDFPTTASAVRPQHGGRQDGVVFKLDYNLRNMIWSTYLGGSGDDAVYSVDVDSRYNVVVCGGTSSRDFPTTEGALQTTYGGGPTDGFVTKITADGRRMTASTYYGARFYDQIYFVRCGRHDEVFVFGQSQMSGSTMIYNAGYSVYNGGMLIARLSADLRGRTWSTLFGTPGRINLSPTAFAADICNRIYAAGWGRDFVGYGGVQWNSLGTTGMETTADAYQSETDGQDFYIMSIDADANHLEYASFFGEVHGNPSARGSDHVDGGTSRFDRMATLYQSVCGSCGRTQNFPTTAGAWCDSNRSNNCNNALFRFNVTDDFPVAEFNAPPAGCAPYAVQFNNMGRGESYRWDFGDGSTSTEATPSHTYSTSGIYTVTLVAYKSTGCSTTDTQRHTVMVIGGDRNGHAPQIACDEEVQIGLVPALGASYHWSGDPVSDATVANPWVGETGTYILTTTATGCWQVDTFKVNAYRLVDSTVVKGNTCHDSTDGSVQLRLGTSVEKDSVRVGITPTAPVSAAYNSGGRWWVRIDSLAPGVDYTVEVDGHGCHHEAEVRIENTPRPTYTKEGETLICSDTCSAWYRISYDGGARDTVRSGLCPGVYTMTIATEDGCPLSDTTLVVRDHTLDSLRVWAEREEVYVGERVQLHASVGVVTNAEVSYRWSPVADLDRPDVADPVATPTDTLACYAVEATIAAGCAARDTLCLHCTEVICGAPLFTIPNAFTPNGDGVNDAVCFNTDEVVEFRIAIFNRWGQCVYSSDDATECWDGTYDGQACLAGVYTYTCHIRCHAEKENDFKGDITLIR